VIDCMLSTGMLAVSSQHIAELVHTDHLNHLLCRLLISNYFETDNKDCPAVFFTLQCLQNNALLSVVDSTTADAADWIINLDCS